eukprot:8731842-Ditylum_brightwellii.AAC.1
MLGGYSDDGVVVIASSMLMNWSIISVGGELESEGRECDITWMVGGGGIGCDGGGVIIFVAIVQVRECL